MGTVSGKELPSSPSSLPRQDRRAPETEMTMSRSEQLTSARRRQDGAELVAVGMAIDLMSAAVEAAMRRHGRSPP